MQWHRLPPRKPDECPHRRAIEPGTAGETATCDLVRQALPFAEARFWVTSNAACAACCHLDPATPAAWNTVVASLVYQAAASVTADPAAGNEAIAQANAVRNRAAVRLRMAAEPAISTRAVQQFNSLRELIPPPARRSPGRIAKWGVGVTTAPRRQPTVERCLDHLTRAGWDAPHLFMDSAVRVPERFGRIPGTLRSPAVGAWPNHYLSLFELTLRQPDADAFLLLQDDAIFYDGENVREYLEQVLWPAGAAPIVSLYCPEPYTAKRYGWHRLLRPWVWGAQAFVFSPQAAKRYLASRRIRQHRWRSAQGGLTQIDVLLGRWAFWRRVPIWLPTPSLVQHVGEVSTLWSDCLLVGPRGASLFVGDPGIVERRAPKV